MAGAPKGNSNAKKGREWFDALRKECVQRAALEALATKVVDLALEGERWAIEEIANRYDGKAAQSVVGSGEDGELELVLRWRE